MLRIRPEQMAKLDQAAGRHFEDWMLGHLKDFFPEKCEQMGEDDVRGMIRHGMKRARSHKIEQGSEVCLYIDTMFLLGKDFDIAPEHEWAREILRSPERKDSPSRAARLHAAARQKQP